MTVERPLRLHSQLTVKAIESLRFASGDEDIRATLYDEFGDAAFRELRQRPGGIGETLVRVGQGEEDEDDEEDAARNKGLPEKKRKKLLDARTWERDGTLVETATRSASEIGGELFEDHNVFRDVRGRRDSRS